MFYYKERINIGVFCEFLKLQNNIRIYTERHLYDHHHYQQHSVVWLSHISHMRYQQHERIYYQVHNLLFIVVFVLLKIISMRPLSQCRLIQCFESRRVRVYATQTDYIYRLS